MTFKPSVSYKCPKAYHLTLRFSRLCAPIQMTTVLRGKWAVFPWLGRMLLNFCYWSSPLSAVATSICRTGYDLPEYTSATPSSILVRALQFTALILRPCLMKHGQRAIAVKMEQLGSFALVWQSPLFWNTKQRLRWRKWNVNIVTNGRTTPTPSGELTDYRPHRGSLYW